MWVIVSLAAGVLQTARNGLARSLSGILPATLLSWSRFAFNLPFATLLIVLLYRFGADGAPALSPRFFWLCAVGGAGQLLGNVALLSAFSSGTFAQAIVLHKTEAVLAAVVGALFFTQDPGPLGWVGIAVSVLGVVLIGLVSAETSLAPRACTEDLSRRRPGADPVRRGEGSVVASLLTANRGTVLALGSAGLLVMASFGIQQATRELGDRNPGVDGTFGLAATTLFHVTWMEVAALTGWLVARRRAAFALVPRHLPRLGAIGLTSFAGSLGWFWAFSLTLVAFVKVVGQIESVLSVLLAIYLWKEQRTREQLPGLALTVAGIFLIVLS